MEDSPILVAKGKCAIWGQWGWGGHLACQNESVFPSQHSSHPHDTATNVLHGLSKRG